MIPSLLIAAVAIGVTAWLSYRLGRAFGAIDERHRVAALAIEARGAQDDELSRRRREVGRGMVAKGGVG